jgi:hypothetical protein
MPQARPKRIPPSDGQRLVEILADMVRSALVWDEGSRELLADSNSVPKTHIGGLRSEDKLSSQPNYAPPSFRIEEDDHGKHSIASE